MRVTIAAGLLALLAGPCGAAPKDLLAGAQWELVRPAAGDAVLTQAAAEDRPGGSRTAMRVTVTRPAEPYYRIMLTALVPADIPAERRLRLRFWARSATGNPLRAVVEKAGAPYTSVAGVSPTLSAAWREYSANGVSPGFGPNGLAVRFQVGHRAGVVEFAGVRLEDLGPDQEMARAREAVRPEAVRERIRRHRTVTLTVRVQDQRGRPVPNATVRVEQRRHAFLFGANIFELDPASTEPWRSAYAERFAALFNFATLSFYWGAYEPQPGETREAQRMAAAEWCRQRGIVTKGHPLVWHEVYPRWAPATASEAIPLLRPRVPEIVRRFRGRVDMWDVVNEATVANGFNNGIGDWARRDGAASLVATALGWARAANPEATLLYNDFNTTETTVELLRDLQRRGSLPDAIGVQSHMHGGPWPLTRVWQVAERFAQFGRPVHFTEVTAISGPPRPDVTPSGPRATDWLTTPADEARQAEYVEQLYALLFSHPRVRAITWWARSDRNAWQGAPAALLRADMSPKPAYECLTRLIKGEW